MPILDPRYMSSWYFMRADKNGNGVIDSSDPRYILERWKEDQIQSLVKKELIQGDIGTRVMEVGGIKWQTEIKSPALILETTSSSNSTNSTFTVFDLLISAYNRIRSYSPLAIQYILKNARIAISEKGVDVSLTFLSDKSGAFIPEFGPDPDLDFIGRTAMNYDTSFTTDELASITQNAFVKSGEIVIDVKISENFFVGTGQAPFFGIQGYSIQGTVEVVVDPVDFYNIAIQYQIPGELVVNSSNTVLTVGSQSLNLGSLRLHSNMSRSLDPAQPAILKYTFQSYSRWSPDAQNN